ncbi:MAG: PaaI family thioesterase [Singulisphaera sp.]|nr:PaaI family thioesterase [Singulisphaera sp.]
MTTMLEHGQKLLRGEQTPLRIARLLGFVPKSIEPGHAIFEMEADERHHNPMGTLHGGIYCDLADAAMGYAYAATLGEGETFTTVELKNNFLRAV